MKERIEKLMTLLQVDEATALDIIKSDERIEKGEKLFELSPTQKKAEKQMRSTGTRTQYTFTTRERKPNNEKRELLQLLENAVCGVSETLVEVVNPERELLFVYKGKKYKIVLSAPRS